MISIEEHLATRAAYAELIADAVADGVEVPPSWVEAYSRARAGFREAIR